MENTNDVTQGSSPVVSEDANTQPQSQETSAVVSESVATQAPGSKTPESNLLAALQEERRMRKEAEDKLKTFNTADSSDEVWSDEGKLLKDQISSLEGQLNSLKEEKELEKLHTQFPALKDKASEFEQFRAEYPRHKLENVAKLFLVEKGLAEAPERKSLEKPTGGTRTPQKSGISAEDAQKLRTSNFKKYLELLQSGQIRPDDIN